MKRILVLLLAWGMSASLVACSESNAVSSNSEPQTSSSLQQNSVATYSEPQRNDSDSKQEIETNAEQFNLYQEWKDTVTGDTMLFKNDGTVMVLDKEYKYEYDEALDIVFVYMAATRNLNIEYDETYQLVIGSSCFVPAEFFEAYHAIAARFFGTWENDTTTITFDDDRRVKYRYRDGEASNNFQASYTVHGDLIRFMEMELIIDTTATPMTLTQVDDETKVYVKTE